MSIEKIVIVGYRPLAGKEAELKALMKDHVRILRKEGLASDREPILMQASNGTIVEVFGWKSQEAIESAHSNPVVQRMWVSMLKSVNIFPLPTFRSRVICSLHLMHFRELISNP